MRSLTLVGVLIIVLSACSQKSGSGGAAAEAPSKCEENMSTSFNFRNATLRTDGGSPHITGIFRNKTGKVTNGDFPVRIYYFDGDGKLLGDEKQRLVVPEYGGVGTKVIKINEESDFSLPITSSLAANAASVRVLHDNGFICGAIISPF